jgi:hypothetical protein
MVCVLEASEVAEFPSIKYLVVPEVEDSSEVGLVYELTFEL